jgi:hypothetical protein
VPRALDTYVAGLPAEEQALIEARTAALQRELSALVGLRQALASVQETVSAHLPAGPASIQKMERRVDLYVGALREALHALGGELEIVARLPGRAPVPLGQFEGLLFVGD